MLGSYLIIIIFILFMIAKFWTINYNILAYICLLFIKSIIPNYFFFFNMFGLEILKTSLLPYAIIIYLKKIKNKKKSTFKAFRSESKGTRYNSQKVYIVIIRQYCQVNIKKKNLYVWRQKKDDIITNFTVAVIILLRNANKKLRQNSKYLDFIDRFFRLNRYTSTI